VVSEQWSGDRGERSI